MRLSNVARGDRLSSRLLYAFVRAVSGFRAPDVVRTLRYRPHLFGRPHALKTRSEIDPHVGSSRSCHRVVVAQRSNA